MPTFTARNLKQLEGGEPCNPKGQRTSRPP
jgi:hypothetical protein